MQVIKALNASPLSAPEAAAAGLITGSSHRSTAIQTLLHSAQCAADPAGLVNTSQKLLACSAAAKKIGLSILRARAASADSATGTPDSVAEAVHTATLPSDSVALKSIAEDPATATCDSSSTTAVSLSDSSVQLAQPAENNAQGRTQDNMVFHTSEQQESSQEDNADLVRRIQAADKPLKRAVVVQITSEALELKCCPAVPVSKYIQVCL